MFKYFALGMQIQSEFEIPGLFPFDFPENDDIVMVEFGTVPDTLQNEILEVKPFSTFNEREFIFHIPEAAKYYITDGNRVLIEPLSDNLDEVLFYLYTGVLATVLYQKNILPFHVSGVVLKNNTVLLFAGHQRAGKSSTSIMLQNRGYLPFTDDTAVLQVSNGHCYATSSYPIIRAMERTLEKQMVYSEEEITPKIKEGFKFGINFHKKFIPEQLPVSGIVFLSEDGDEVTISPMKAADAIKLLKFNVYRKQWVHGMKKELLEFQTISQIAQSKLQFFTAKRPWETDSFESLAQAIEDQIIHQIGK
ncbi:hypothetical protein [Aquirufa nivalisilvae]|uniref:hypothetical protein n=1 Tax=Aquirufa nivalisilvae TaxID=2516557 RepID=UPI00103300DA|nr:hypothetical protein [Aquirufa nivalisilvae]TBH72273.1 hypothetical protein EWU22_10830 [Aquirufa nivalisilvae]